METTQLYQSTINYLADFLNQFKKTIDQRYNGDFEFNEFKSLTNRTLVIITFFIVVTVLYIILAYSLATILKNFSTAPADIDNTLKTLAILFGLYFTYLVYKINSKFDFLKSSNELPNSIKISKWTPHEIILEEALDQHKKIQFSVSGKYALYLVCQAYDGRFYYYSISNQKGLLDSPHYIKKTNTIGYHYNEKLEINQKGNVEVSFAEIKASEFITEQKDEKGITKITTTTRGLAKIVAIGIRGNVLNEQSEIQQLKITNT